MVQVSKPTPLLPLRTFETPQRAAWTRVSGRRLLQFLELRCPRCRRKTYVSDRKRRLARTGSEREYAVCAWCGVNLTLGQIATYPNGNGLLSRLRFWRRERGAGTMEAD